MMTDKKVEINLLNKKDVKNFCNLARTIISNTDHYPKAAKINEIKKYDNKIIELGIKYKNTLHIILKNGDKIVGFSSGFIYGGVLWIDWLGVDKHFRNKGLAINLINYLENKAKKSKVHKISCVTLINNKQSINLLKKLQYKKNVLLKNDWYNLDYYLWEKFI